MILGVFSNLHDSVVDYKCFSLPSSRINFHYSLHKCFLKLWILIWNPVISLPSGMSPGPSTYDRCAWAPHSAQLQPCVQNGPVELQHWRCRWSSSRLCRHTFRQNPAVAVVLQQRGHSAGHQGKGSFRKLVSRGLPFFTLGSSVC